MDWIYAERGLVETKSPISILDGHWIISGDIKMIKMISAMKMIRMKSAMKSAILNGQWIISGDIKMIKMKYDDARY